MKIISIANRKGGIGKTTFAANLSYELSREKKKVLMVDLDGQCDLTKIYEPQAQVTVLDVLEGKEEVEDVVVEVKDNLYILSGSREIVHLDNKLEAELLKNHLHQLRDEMEPDYVILDHPPNISEAALQGFVASDEVLVVAEPENLCLQNLNSFLEDLSQIKQEMNPDLHILGVAINRVDKRRNLTERMIGKLRHTFTSDVFETEISNDTAIPTSMQKRVPVRELKWRSRTVSQFQNLLKEIEGRL